MVSSLTGSRPLAGSCFGLNRSPAALAVHPLTAAWAAIAADLVKNCRVKFPRSSRTRRHPGFAHCRRACGPEFGKLPSAISPCSFNHSALRPFLTWTAVCSDRHSETLKTPQQLTLQKIAKRRNTKHRRALSTAAKAWSASSCTCTTGGQFRCAKRCSG
jgi:hypothetical protein